MIRLPFSVKVDGEVNLWVGVIQDAWYTALRDKKIDDKKPNMKSQFDMEQQNAINFFRNEDSMLKWICDSVNGLDYVAIRELFERSVIDEDIKQKIITSYSKNRYWSTCAPSVEELSEYM